MVENTEETRVSGDQQPERGLKFSIENILRPEFGCAKKVSKTEEISKDAETVWPAWVYCTRYSDRPSSGESLAVFISHCCIETRRFARCFWGVEMVRQAGSVSPELAIRTNSIRFPVVLIEDIGVQVVAQSLRAELCSSSVMKHSMRWQALFPWDHHPARSLHKITVLSSKLTQDRYFVSTS
ncbi:hypothetical protein GE061_002648 [Apolygus lucorum]|uniref:Uncharacterized protein n=1 Tax=Apolygus lucorum TaxID=248454 RepID=A0A6A4JIH6_APOLU|nr:hypothetical protein GE061_002648 [Apolygus lucorum]